jgi:predicted alpha/beta hydrolase
MPPEAPDAPGKPRRRSRPPSRPRPAPPESPGSETLEIRTADGWSLRAHVREPPREPVGVVVLGHAMMARQTEFERPAGAGLAPMLVERGWRVISFDFRGHGDSGPAPKRGTGYGYDDLVTGDLPALHAFARSKARRKRPVVLMGHSLGAHVGLAAQGTGLVAFDGIVGVGANVWLEELEPSKARWLVKRGLLAAMSAVVRRVGCFPARALRLGSDDEARGYVEDFERFARTGAWTSADGRVDYLASLASVRVPFLQIVSDGDRIECVPDCGARFAALCGGGHEVFRIATADDGGPPPDHMRMVTGGRVASVWERTQGWMSRLLAR